MPTISPGFAIRDYFWDLATEIQHQVSQGLSVTVGYGTGNWSDHFSTPGNFDAGVTDNLLVTPDDFSPYGVRAPSDPRLPGGGGRRCVRVVRCGASQIRPGE